MPKTLSAAAKQAISQAQKARWAAWRKRKHPKRHRVPDVLPVINPPGTNGAIAEMNVALHVQGQTVQLTSDEAAALYDALGVILHKHGLSAT